MNEMLLAARTAGLRYVDPADPGIRRVRRGRGFGYVDAKGETVTDEKTLERIEAIVIPPAWQDVWISPYAIGHIQATGRDARGRLQYRYHPMWAQVRDATKYERTIAFARALPRLRRRVARDMRLRGLPRQKVVAAAVRLLETALIRVGNEEYAKENKSFGVTTLRGRHVRVKGSTLKFTYRGKSGKEHSVDITDRRLARVVRAVDELPGQRLFQYVDEDGEVQSIDSDDVNEYIRAVIGDEFSAKDFRTWAGTVLALRALLALEAEAPTNSAVTAAVKEVAAQLGNTPAVCRRCYIHPVIVDSYLDGSLSEAAAAPTSATASNRTPSGLRADEKLVLSVLRRRVARARRKSSSIHNVQRRAA
jgi:DNA topoisomerase-1